jgi:hypothetical protein
LDVSGSPEVPVSDVSAEAVFETTADALQEKRKLRRHFRRFDIFFYLICTVVTLDTIGAVASNGAQGFTWLVFLGIFFFLPYALSIAELGSAFPQEGGPYVWTRLAFGRPLAVIIVVGLVFYLLGGKTRREKATEPITAVNAASGDAD